MELHKAMDQHGLISDPYYIIVFAKSSYNRAPKHRMDLEALTDNVWNTQVKSILSKEWKRKLGYHIDVSIKCTSKKPLKDKLK